MGAIFQAASQLGALGVALLALYWTRQDKAEAVKAFTALNDERKAMADKMTQVMQDVSVKIATLEAYIRDHVK